MSETWDAACAYVEAVARSIVLAYHNCQLQCKVQAEHVPSMVPLRKRNGYVMQYC